MDKIRAQIIALLTLGVSERFSAKLRQRHKNFSVPHPSLSRGGLQTVELPLEDYHTIATEATKLLQSQGYHITVVYDETDGVRAFVPQFE